MKERNWFFYRIILHINWFEQKIKNKMQKVVIHDFHWMLAMVTVCSGKFSSKIYYIILWCGGRRTTLIKRLQRMTMVKCSADERWTPRPFGTNFIFCRKWSVCYKCVTISQVDQMFSYQFVSVDYIHVCFSVCARLSYCLHIVTFVIVTHDKFAHFVWSFVSVWNGISESRTEYFDSYDSNHSKITLAKL